MIASIVLLLILIHWGFMLGVHLASTTELKLIQLLMICIAIKYFFMVYGYK